MPQLSLGMYWFSPWFSLMVSPQFWKWPFKLLGWRGWPPQYCPEGVSPFLECSAFCIASRARECFHASQGIQMHHLSFNCDRWGCCSDWLTVLWAQFHSGTWPLHSQCELCKQLHHGRQVVCLAQWQVQSLYGTPAVGYCRYSRTLRSSMLATHNY